MWVLKQVAGVLVRLAGVVLMMLGMLIEPTGLLIRKFGQALLSGADWLFKKSRDLETIDTDW